MNAADLSSSSAVNSLVGSKDHGVINKNKQTGACTWTQPPSFITCKSDNSLESLIVNSLETLFDIKARYEGNLLVYLYLFIYTQTNPQTFVIYLRVLKRHSA